MELTLSVLRCPDSVVPEQRRVPGGDFIIGRGADAGWVLPDPDRLLSKHHCVLEFRGGGWQVRDLSTNGTFVNHADTPVGRDHVKMLEDGDRLRLGAYEIEVRVEQAGAQPGGWGMAPPAAAPSRGGWDPAPPQQGWAPAAPAAGGWDAPPAAPAPGAWGAPAASPGWGAAQEQPWGAPPPRDEPLQPRLPGDPFLGARPPAGDMPGLPSGSGMPADHDPFNAGPAMPDHRPSTSDAFLPPRPMQQVPVIPDAWDVGPTPSTPVAPPPAPAAAPGRIPDDWNFDLSPAPAATPPRPAAPAAAFAPPAAAPGGFAPPPGPAAHAPPPPPAAGFAPLPGGPDPFAAPPAAPPFAPPPAPAAPFAAPAAHPAAPVGHPAAPAAPPPAGFAPPGHGVPPTIPDPFAEPAAAPPARDVDPFAEPAPPARAAVDPFAEPPAPPPAVAPAPPVVSAAPPAPAHHAPVGGAGGEAGLAAFLAGAGLPAHLAANQDPDAALRALGAAFHAAVSGLRQLLIARADVKREFRIEQTMLRSAGNNPVKFAASDEQALASLLTAGPQVGPRAVRETVEDLTAHQVATLAATQAAARALLARLAPEGLEAQEGGGGGGLFASKDKKLWESYKRLHQQVTEQFDDDFDSAFGKEFARAYEQASRK
jgi:type VI secretion system FHA domain protein